MVRLTIRLISLFFVLQLGQVQAADLQPRIIGGNDADAGEWPATVALLVTDVYNTQLVTQTQAEAQEASQYCAGTLLAPNWVLTAAHCVHDGGALVSAADILVLAGITSLTDSGQLRVVTNIIVHPDYIPSQFNNDLALIELANEAVEPAAAITLYQGDPAVDSDATVVGWGDTTNNNNILPDTLQEVVLQIVSNEDCNATGVYNGTITDNMICAAAPGKDSCTGDSGGPLMALQDSEFRQVGLVSFGNECALPGFPGVYTRLARFETWIEDIMANGADVIVDNTDDNSVSGGISFPGTVPDPAAVIPPSGDGSSDSDGSGGGGSFGGYLLASLLLLSRRSRLAGKQAANALVQD